jgi:hypothetical protein
VRLSTARTRTGSQQICLMPHWALVPRSKVSLNNLSYCNYHDDPRKTAAATPSRLHFCGRRGRRGRDQTELWRITGRQTSTSFKLKQLKLPSVQVTALNIELLIAS